VPVTAYASKEDGFDRFAGFDGFEGFDGFAGFAACGTGNGRGVAPVDAHAEQSAATTMTAT